MTSSDVLKATLLDIVFETRNKQYGAYALRKQYNQRLVTALGISVTIVLSVLFLIAANKNKAALAMTPLVPIEDVIVHTKVIPPPDIPPPPPPVKQQPVLQAAQQQYTQINITTNAAAVTDVPAQSDLKNVVIFNATVTGTPAEAVPAIAAPIAAELASTANTAPAYAEPQFPGGAAAWRAFLSRYLQAPETLEPGEKTTVVVQFMVAEDGTVTVITIAQSGGRAFDAEVIRVLKKMPKWQPALKNGLPVAVPFTQPVTFIAMGD